MQLNLDIDYGRTAKQQDSEPNIETTVNIINSMVNSVYQQGMPAGPERRAWGRLQRLFDKAIETKNPIIELETVQKELLDKVRKENTLPPQWAKYVDYLEDELASLGNIKGKTMDETTPEIPETPAGEQEPVDANV